MKIIEWFKLPEIKEINNLDDPATTLLHGEIIQRKGFLKKLYTDFYGQFKESVPDTEGKVLVELGSGGGFIKDVIDNVITSDIIELPNVDKVFSACEMPFEKSSVDAFFMFNVLHHIVNPRKFFSESLRCLKTNGKVVMIEPANTVWSRFIYKNFHHEQFDADAKWELEDVGPLSGGNDAMGWIIFNRDRKKFEEEFPHLKIVRMYNHTPLRYLLSGGFTLRQLAPSFSYPIFKALELALSPFNNLLGMFQTVELEKCGEFNN